MKTEGRYRRRGKLMIKGTLGNLAKVPSRGLCHALHAFKGSRFQGFGCAVWGFEVVKASEVFENL